MASTALITALQQIPLKTPQHRRQPELYKQRSISRVYQVTEIDTKFRLRKELVEERFAVLVRSISRIFLKIFIALNKHLFNASL